MQLRVRRTGCLRPSSAQAGCKPAAAHLHRALLGARSAADLAACRRRIYTISNAGSASAGLPAEGDASNISAAQGSSSREDKPKKSLWGHIKYFFVGDGLDKDRLKALGMGAFASYGFISNLNYGTALGVAWLAFVKKYGVAPTAPGQWKVFLAFYAGLWTLQNFARPLRISLALALAPVFDKGIATMSEKLNIDKKWAFGIFLLCMGIITSVTLFGTIYLLGGFPQA